MTTTTPPTSNRVDMLMVLRAVACVMVVLVHSWYDGARPVPGSLVIAGLDFSWMLRGSAQFAVMIFFTLSGYLMGKGFYTGRYAMNVGGAVAFYLNRLLRILPLYLYVILFVLIFLNPSAVIQQPDQISRLLTFSFHKNFFGLEHFWSVCVEMQFYLLVPFLALLLFPRVQRLRDAMILFVFCLAAGIAFRHFAAMCVQQYGMTQDNYPSLGARGLLFGSMYFTAGFTLNTILPHLAHIKILRSVRCVAQGVLLTLIFGVAAWHQHLVDTRQLLPLAGSTIYPLVIVIIVCVFIVLTEMGTTRNENFSWKAVRRNPFRVVECFGVLTYGIYLWHMPIMYNVHRTLPAEMIGKERAFYTCVIAFAVSVVVAALTYLTIERPAERVKVFHVALPEWITARYQALRSVLPARHSTSKIPASPDCADQEESAPRPIPG